MPSEILRLDNISKSYDTANGKLPILQDLSLSISSGEIVAIVGQSGSGKSTLLSVAALLLRKDSGRILYKGVDSDSMSPDDISALRKSGMGFVFQSSMLLEDFSALENIAMPLMIQGLSRKNALEKASEYLEMVSLSSRASHRSAGLSGGERQRIAIARALAPSPYILFADEPTGSLDEKSADSVSELLFNVIRKEEKGMLLVTHNKELASSCDKTYVLKGGNLELEC